MYVVQNNFSGGCLSDKLLMRNDLAKYTTGCRKLENLIVDMYGNVVKRNGAEFFNFGHGEKYYQWKVSDHLTLLMVFNGNLITVYDKNFCEITKVTCFLFDINSTTRAFDAISVGNKLFIATGNYPILEITLYPEKIVENTVLPIEKLFSVKEFEYICPPMNTSDKYVGNVKVERKQNSSGDEIYHAVFDEYIYDDKKNNGFIKIDFNRKKNLLSVDLKKISTEDYLNDKKNHLEIKGYWSLNTHGTWNGKLVLQRSVNGDEWTDYRIFTSALDNNISTSGTEEEDFVKFRFNMVEYSPNSTSGTIKFCRVILTNTEYVDSLISGLKIEDFHFDDQIYYERVQSAVSSASYLNNVTNHIVSDKQSDHKLLINGTWKGICYLEMFYQEEWVTWLQIEVNDERTFIRHKKNNQWVIYASFLNDEYRVILLGNLEYKLRFNLINYTAGTSGIKTCAMKIFSFFSKNVYRLLCDPKKMDNYLDINVSNFQISEFYYNNYPESLIIHQERLILANTKDNPYTIWASKVNQWNNFNYGVYEDSPMALSIANDYTNKIHWLKISKDLIIGASNAIYTLSAIGGAKNANISPTNFLITPIFFADIGSVKPIVFNQSLIFISENKVYEILYNSEVEDYEATDLTIFAEHLFDNNKIKEIIYYPKDYKLLVVTANGNVPILTYNRTHEVFAWENHTFPQKVNKIIKGFDYTKFLLISNNLLYWDFGGDNIKIDYTSITIPHEEEINKLIISQSFKFQDIYVFIYRENILSEIIKPSRINKSQYGDIELFFDEKIILEKVSKILVGESIKSIFETMPLELHPQVGNSLLLKKSVKNIALNLINSVGGKIRVNDSQQNIIYSRDNDDLNTLVKEKSELVKPIISHNPTINLTINLMHNEPYNFGFNALGFSLKIEEN